jgi:four helix bundle protein
MNLPLSNQSGAPAHATRSSPALFDHERLDVYQLELRFISWVTPLMEEAKKAGAGKTREVCDQLDRASLSSLLNTAEGNGKRRGQIRARFFDDARGSATECAGCLDALVAKGVFSPERMVEGKTMLLRIVSMLCKLVDRFDEAGDRLHEDAVEYRINSEELPQARTRTSTRTSTRTRSRPRKSSRDGPNYGPNYGPN